MEAVRGICLYQCQGELKEEGGYLFVLSIVCLLYLNLFSGVSFLPTSPLLLLPQSCFFASKTVETDVGIRAVPINHTGGVLLHA